MNTIHDYYHQLIDIAQSTRHRFGVVLRGDQQWTQAAVQTCVQQTPGQNCFQLGGEAVEGVSHYAKFNKGQQLLGQECALLICDLSTGFDANSFTAVMGCLVGGGIAIILPNAQETMELDKQWLNHCLDDLLVIEQGGALPSLPRCLEADKRQESESGFYQQNLAVEKIRKVVEGHRKRPLVMTADRGRGKSSALGIAAAQLMKSRTLSIYVTAPNRDAVQAVFEHAIAGLTDAQIGKNRIELNGSSLEFIAPDELLRHSHQCDLLVVDEASAIPIPMLKRMVERYHRAVFSTTIHGYEGCGRGFTIKFQQWLKQQRPASVFYHIHQPIRWNEHDPLEEWLFDTFLLNAELPPMTQRATKVTVEKIDKLSLLAKPEKLSAIFALLVNAHYQTTPNDLMSLLSNDAIQVHAMFADNGNDDICVGCVLAVEEGSLDAALIEQIQLGKRRPKGHLVPVLLANQLGLTQAATCPSLRVMRIAVHPDRHRQGIGRAIIDHLSTLSQYTYLSTSFGATDELVSFWRSCGFEPIKLGSQRDSASGTHSLVMLKGELEHLDSAQSHFQPSFRFSLVDIFRELEIELIRNLLVGNDASVVKPSALALIQNYCLGGSSYDSVAPFLEQWWRESPSLVHFASELYIRRLIQRHSWQRCVDEFQLSGRKQAEQMFRQDLAKLIDAVIV